MLRKDVYRKNGHVPKFYQLVYIGKEWHFVGLQAAHHLFVEPRYCVTTNWVGRPQRSNPKANIIASC